MRTVPRRRTSLTLPEMAAVLSSVWPARDAPSRYALAGYLTILAVENDGGRAINGHNWGNLIAGRGWPGDVWTHEAHGRTYHFRVYPSHEAGALAWARLMLDRYPSVLAAAGAWRLARAAEALYSAGYVDADSGRPELYERAMRRWLAPCDSAAASGRGDTVGALAWVGTLVGGALNASSFS